MNNIRSCIACRKKDNKYNLVRIVADEDNNAKVDSTCKINARGIYICNNRECINKLLKMKNINKVIKNNIRAESLKRLLVEMEDM